MFHNPDFFMKRALKLAAKGRTSPNPMVGAIIVKDGKIIGEGYHPKAGEPHAEIFAINAAGEKTHGAEMYVTLEPCSHFGRTPPCADAVINAGIRKVYAAMEDPNPLVAGAGIQKLKNAGIEVNVGLLESDAQELNKGFIKRITTGMPYVLWKAAMSIDGKIASNTGDSKWITGDKSRAAVQKLRNNHDAILTGIGTVIADDPEMTIHGMKNYNNPIRIIADSKASIPADSKILNNKARTILAIGDNISADKTEILSEKCDILKIPLINNDQLDLKILMRELGSIGINTVMLESGGELAASMLREGLIDSGIVFIAPKIIGGRSAKSIIGGSGIDFLNEAINTSSFKIRRYGDDIALIFNVMNI